MYSRFGSFGSYMNSQSTFSQLSMHIFTNVLKQLILDTFYELFTIRPIKDT